MFESLRPDQMHSSGHVDRRDHFLGLVCDIGCSRANFGRLRRSGAIHCEVPRPIQGTDHSASAAVQHVRVDHRRADVGVPEQFLNRPDVITRFEQVRGERVAAMPPSA